MSRPPPKKGAIQGESPKAPFLINVVFCHIKTMRVNRSETNRQGLNGSADLAFTLKIKNSNNNAKLYARYPEYFHDIGCPFKIGIINVGKEVGNIDDSFIQDVLLYLGEESSSEYREAIMDRLDCHGPFYCRNSEALPLGKAGRRIVRLSY